MPTHHEKRILPHAPQKLFNLVADVAAYPEFLPWCAGSRINWRKDNVFNADVMIGYKALRETFNSTVTLSPYQRIDVTYENGPFSELTNYWLFQPLQQQSLLHCEVTFFINFSFRSTLLSNLIGPLFQNATLRMIDAFEQRADSLKP